MISAGNPKDLVFTLVDSAGAPIESGTCFAIVWLESDGDADDGYYWDGADWVSGLPATLPTATHKAKGSWAYTLAAAATAGKSAGAVYAYGYHTAEGTQGGTQDSVSAAIEHTLLPLAPSQPGGSAPVIPPPSASDLCVIYGTLKDVSGAVVPGGTITFVARVPQVVGSQLTKTKVTATAGVDGQWNVELIQGAIADISSPEAGISDRRTVPYTASQAFEEWT